MPDFGEIQWDQLKQRYKSKSTIQLVVDPQENGNEDHYKHTIQTETLTSDDTMHTMRSLLKKSLNFVDKLRAAHIEKIYHTTDSLRYAEPSHCKKSEEIIDFVRIYGCIYIKHLLKDADIKEHTEWDYTLKRLIKLSLDIFSHPTKDAKKYLNYLETNLLQISATMSVAARSEVNTANKKLRCIVKTPKKTTTEDRQMEEDLKRIQHQLKAAMDKFDSIMAGAYLQSTGSHV